jgi:hypothetical protein
LIKEDFALVLYFRVFRVVRGSSHLRFLSSSRYLVW